MDLIITEKPNVSKQVKDVIAPYAKYKNLSKGGNMPLGYYEDQNFVICNTVGHCVEIFNPKEIDSSFTWNLDVLPYNLPEDLPLKVSDDKKPLFNTIQKCFSMYNYDRVYVCTDPDREGENIWRKINKMLKPYKANQILRVWIHEWTPEGLQNAFDNAFPDSEKDGLANAAKCREEADYIIGMNCSVGLTTKYAEGKGNVVSIGRVMGPTMHIVYEREKEIQNFKPEPYTAVSIETTTDDLSQTLRLSLVTDKKLTKEEAEKIQRSVMRDKSIVLNKTVRRETKRCPEQYDATTIAQDMNRRYGLSAKETADIIQRLYQEYALTTYPGTNARKISVGSAGKAYELLRNLPVRKDICDEIMENGWEPASHVVTTEGLAHEAITPVYGTSKVRDLSVLRKNERLVYDAIVERYLAVFYPRAEFEVSTIVGVKTGNEFTTFGKTVINEGWMKILGKPNDRYLPSVTDGKSYMIQNFIKEEKETTPPSRYTEESLLSAMKNAGRFVDDVEDAKLLNSKEVEGLGTGRTRPAILENIKRRGYFQLNKKTLYPTQKCMDLFDIMPDTTLSSPALTAQFERMIQAVEDGEMTPDEYRQKIDANVADIIGKIKSDSRNVHIAQGGTKVGESSTLICPKCGRPLFEHAKGFSCTGYKTKECDFIIWKTICEKSLTDAQIKSLIEKKKTGVIKGFKSKKGSTFDARLILKPDFTIGFEFESSTKPAVTKGTNSHSLVCPKCGRPLQETDRAFGCSGWREGCDFKIWKTISGKTLTVTDVNDLLESGKTRLLKGFKSKKGSTFDARLVLDSFGNLSFEFDNKKR